MGSEAFAFVKLCIAFTVGSSIMISEATNKNI